MISYTKYFYFQMLPVRLLLAVFGATFGCTFLFGFNIGVLNNINHVRLIFVVFLNLCDIYKYTKYYEYCTSKFVFTDVGDS